MHAAARWHGACTRTPINRLFAADRARHGAASDHRRRTTTTRRYQTAAQRSAPAAPRDPHYRASESRMSHALSLQAADAHHLPTSTAAAAIARPTSSTTSRHASPLMTLQPRQHGCFLKTCSKEFAKKQATHGQ